MVQKWVGSTSDEQSFKVRSARLSERSRSMVDWRRSFIMRVRPCTRTELQHCELIKLKVGIKGFKKTVEDALDL